MYRPFQGNPITASLASDESGRGGAAATNNGSELPTTSNSDDILRAAALRRGLSSLTSASNGAVAGSNLSAAAAAGSNTGCNVNLGQQYLNQLALLVGQQPQQQQQQQQHLLQPDRDLALQLFAALHHQQGMGSFNFMPASLPTNSGGLAGLLHNSHVASTNTATVAGTGTSGAGAAGSPAAAMQPQLASLVPCPAPTAAGIHPPLALPMATQQLVDLIHGGGRGATCSSINPVASGLLAGMTNAEAQVLLKMQEDLLRETRLLLQRQEQAPNTSVLLTAARLGRREEGEEAQGPRDLGNGSSSAAARTSVRSPAGSATDRMDVDHGDAADGADDDYDEDDADYAEEDQIDDVTFFKNFDTDDSNKLNNETFPFRLYRMLHDLEQTGRDDIVAFYPHGRAFVVKRPHVFMKEIMPKYFSTARLASFQRQLNLYGFQRIAKGREKGAYSHQFFLKGERGLCRRIRRQHRRPSKLPPAMAAATVAATVSASGGPMPHTTVSSSSPVAVFVTPTAAALPQVNSQLMLPATGMLEVPHGASATTASAMALNRFIASNQAAAQQVTAATIANASAILRQAGLFPPGGGGNSGSSTASSLNPLFQWAAIMRPQGSQVDASNIAAAAVALEGLLVGSAAASSPMAGSQTLQTNPSSSSSAAAGMQQSMRQIQQEVGRQFQQRMQHGSLVSSSTAAPSRQGPQDRRPQQLSESSQDNRSGSSQDEEEDEDTGESGGQSGTSTTGSSDENQAQV